MVTSCSTVVDQTFSKARKLKLFKNYKIVFTSPDCLPEQRDKQRDLVYNLKLGKRGFINKNCQAYVRYLSSTSGTALWNRILQLTNISSSSECKTHIENLAHIFIDCKSFMRQPRPFILSTIYCWSPVQGQ